MLIHEEFLPRFLHHNISESYAAFQVFQRNKIRCVPILPFPESESVEFKQFSTKHIQEYANSIIAEHIYTLANTLEESVFSLE